MSRILITGANSFIGWNYIRYSKFSSIDEISLRNYNYESLELGRYDVILHLAAIVHQSFKIEDDEYFRINRDLCLEVASLAKKAGVRQFVLLSTIKVFGDFKNRLSPWDEKSDCNPVDSYGRSKLEAEIALRKLESPEFIVSIIRSPVVYGLGVKANILKLIKMVEISPILPFAGINNRRNYIFTENLVAYIDKIIEKRASGTFIVMDDESISTTDLVKQISKGLGKKIILFRLPSFLIKIGVLTFPRYFDRLFGSFVLDNTWTKTRLDFSPPYDINEGLHKTMDAYKNVSIIKIE